MYKTILSLLLFVSITNASLVGSNYNQRDLQILKELDIGTSYITNYKLQKSYSRILSRAKKGYVKKLNDASQSL